MAVEVITLQATVAANGVDTPIGEFTVGEQEKVIVLEVGFAFTGVGTIDGFVRQRQIDDVGQQAAPDPDHRVVKNLPLMSGDTYSFKGTDLSGASNPMAVVVVLDRTIAGF